MSMKIVTGGNVEVGNKVQKAALPGLKVDDARKEAAAATQPSAIATQPSPATQPSALSNEAQAAAIQAQNVERALASILKVVAHVPDATEYLVRRAA